jgi:hypothetical protein
MSSDLNIRCPHCKKPFALTDSIAAPMLEAQRKQMEADASVSLERARIEAKLDADRAAAMGSARTIADLERKSKDAEKAAEELRKTLSSQDLKLAEAQRVQADATRKARELEEAKRELDLTVERKVSSGLEAVRNQAKLEATEAERLKVAEKQHTIEMMGKQIEELRQRAEQGSQQLQGEAQELELETMLAERFDSTDEVEPIAKGVNGADCLLRVRNPSTEIGTILFESKRTKAFSQGWLPKLRTDQRSAKADIAVLVSQALPDGVKHFDCLEGVWVCSLASVVPLTIVLRAGLFAVHAARRNSEGFETKAQSVYAYLTGPAFKHRLQGAVEAIKSLQDGLEKEKRALTKQWAVRAASHDAVIASLVGLHGDVAGIAGASVPELDNASLKELGAGEE